MQKKEIDEIRKVANGSSAVEYNSDWVIKA